MGKQTYKLSFTASGLAISESISIANAYLTYRDWSRTKDAIKENNILQSRTNSRTVRLTREIIQRLSLLGEDQLELLAEGNLTEQKYLLWFAVCKTYSLIKEFAIEVLHEKFLSRNMQLTELDYVAFFNRKADWNEELDQITESTRVKLRTNLFRMMREADLITNDNLILRSILSSRLVDVLKLDAPMSFQIFPTDPSDMRG
jgi:hypothetical protein